MNDGMKNKMRLFGLPVLILLLGVLLFWALRGCERQEEDLTARSITVITCQGDVGVERGQDKKQVYEGMKLTSGDKVHVEESSLLKMNLDDNKIVQTDDDTQLAMEAAGNRSSGLTRIELLWGGITCYVKEKLDENSTFEVTTPNATMAVRGTVFYVYWRYNEFGNPRTHIITLEGSVECTNHYTGETVPVSSAEMAIVELLGNGTCVTTVEPVDYSLLSLEAIQYLIEVTETRELCISREELIRLLEEPENKPQEETVEEQLPEEEEEPEAEPEKILKLPENSILADVIRQTEDSDGSYDSSNSSNGSSGNTGGLQNPGTPADPAVPETSAQYTVTFRYGSRMIGTQTVTEGEKAVLPKLQPTENGSWDEGAFDKPVTADVTIWWTDSSGNQEN